MNEPQIQNPARLRSPRIPGTTDQHMIERKLLGQMRAHVHGGKTLSTTPRRMSPAGLTHPKGYLDASGNECITPHAIKERKARRAKNAVAKQSRKVNRGR